MLSSEKKSLYRFISIYITFVITIIFTISVIYYNSNIDRVKLEYKSIMQDFATLQIRRLKWLHSHYPNYSRYPRDNRFKSAIYDLEYREIFSTLNSKYINLEATLYFNKEYAIYVETLSDYYLGAKYLLIEIPKDNKMLYKIYKNIAIYSSIFFIVMLLIGLYLARLFIQPMKSSIEILNNFIKDTTHEINTPISIINSNIEMLKLDQFNPKDSKKLKRIKIASRTLEGIYKDLKFTTLEQINKSDNEEISLKLLIKERIEYFSYLLDSKQLSIYLDLNESIIKGNRALYIRLIDNIISNAIKYNKVGGRVDIYLNSSELIVEDSGIGMNSKEINRVFDRYSRFSEHEGGFGLGLNIVKKIADYYNLKIDIESKKNIGTRFIIRW